MSNYTVYIPESVLYELLQEKPIRAGRKSDKYTKTAKATTKPSKSKLRGNYEPIKRN